MNEVIKKSFLFFCMLCMSVLAHAQSDTIRVLTIGNSFSEDAVEQYLCELGREVGVEMVIGNGYRGGQGFASHWKDVTEQNNTFEYRKVVNGRKTNRRNSALKTLIADEPWDYITVQQASPESGLLSTFEPCMTELIQYAQSICTNPDVQLGYHMTWAYSHDSTHGGFANYGSSQQTMYDSITCAVQQAMALHPELAFVVPSGTAIQNARGSWLGDNLNRDGYHLDYVFGRYTSACTWLERLTGRSSVGLRYCPKGMDSVTAYTCQMAAHLACASPYTVSDMSHVGYPLVNDIRPTGRLKFNFGNEPSNDASWNDIGTNVRTHTYVLDEFQHPTAVTLTALQPMAGSNANGVSYTTTRMLMPARVSSSALWGYATGKFGNAQARPLATYVLGHLNPKLRYDFVIYASRQGCKDYRQATYVVQGDESHADNLETAENMSETVRFKGVRPTDDGKITISVMPGPHNTNPYKFYYLNAMVVRAH